VVQVHKYDRQRQQEGRNRHGHHQPVDVHGLDGAANIKQVNEAEVEEVEEGEKFKKVFRQYHLKDGGNSDQNLRGRQEQLAGDQKPFLCFLAEFADETGKANAEEN